ncbi:hypothetical protein D0T12_00500 [Actinomadura spongiicola]|uniref:Uncharacterized protein n=1 Tax=Actinomadura spongiicola TaxID=2303421 RepID=A0A372GN97_9ACTN|nr:hypothetical protein [Actinomadura spongiicola]RFS86805.1 hypothetical protein D0T12_00500 [Actinomadura spongiicola]
MSVSTTVLPLAGVVLGSAGTLIGQYLSTRVEARRARFEQASAERSERKAALLEFLSAAQQVELCLDRLSMGEQLDDSERWQHLHALWLAKKVPELVCSSPVAQAAHDYTAALHALLRGQAVGEGTPSKRDLRFAFLEAARRELGTADEPLRRDLPVRELGE